MNRIIQHAPYVAPALVISLCSCGGEFDQLDAEPEVPFEVEAVVETTSSALLDIGGNPTLSNWSGRSGGSPVTLNRTPIDDAFLAGYTFSERYDDPCHFVARYDHIETRANRGSQVWNECGMWGPNYASGKVGLVPSLERTVGMAVCLNSDRTKMKGFALLSQTPECILSGGDCDVNTNTYDERPNCPGADNGVDFDWEEHAMCPPGYIVTGIVLNTRAGGGNRRMVNGVRAYCHPLQERD
ncbi:MAG: hypothetical protein KC933_35175 [Myxococcales bacterium]|nr:hypothetical protein [Myxococcales bacterium]MCB9647462.1 hypothetical protein [Deltaproteobacteria bacterium]